MQLLEKIRSNSIKNPDKIAIVKGLQNISYFELNKKSDELAYFLKNKNINTVAICLEPNIFLAISILGSLKGNITYVPIDPSLPSERIKLILEKSKSDLLIAYKNLELDYKIETTIEDGFIISSASNNKEGKIFNFNSFQESKDINKNQNIALILFTSGSTGIPKGVNITNKNLDYYLEWYCNDFCKKNPVCLPLTSSISFAAAITQFFPPLITNKTLYIPDENLIQNPKTLILWFKNNSGLGLYCVPTVWEAIISYLENCNESINNKAKKDAYQNLFSSIILSGEDINDNLMNRTFKIFPKLNIWNFYGPTEATANISYSKLQKNKEITIGHPIKGSKLYLLDEKLKHVKQGEIGEIYCEGEGITNGYYGEPSLTIQSFISNPFKVNRSEDLALEPSMDGFIIKAASTQNDEKQVFEPFPKSFTKENKIYKTGDFGKLNSNNEIIFKGRKDYQIKIRGNRVELKEIEYHIKKYEKIEKVLVLPALIDNIQLIIAFLKIKSQVNISEAAKFYDQLRNFLSNKLALYMIPSKFILLKKFPLLPNGKIDKKKLNSFLSVSKNNFDNSSITKNQSLILKIWQEAFDNHLYRTNGKHRSKTAANSDIYLNFSQNVHIYLEDNFFELGGHSLIAMQIISNIKEHFDFEVEITKFFELPVLKDFSDYIEEHIKTNNSQLIVKKEQKKFTYNKISQLSFAQEQLWFDLKLGFPVSVHHIPLILELEFKNSILNVEVLKSALNSILEENEILRIKIFKKEGIPYQQIFENQKFPFFYKKLIRAENARNNLSDNKIYNEYKEELDYEISKPFNFEKGLLCRALLLEIENNDGSSKFIPNNHKFILCITFHHLIFDDISSKIFHRALIEKYNFLLNNSKKIINSQHLEKSSIKYFDLVLSEQGVNKNHEKTLVFWKRKLENFTSLESIYNYKIEKNSYKASLHQEVISLDILKKLETLCGETNSTLFMVLLTIFQGVLSYFSNEKDFVISAPVTNRDFSKIDNLIGLYINILVLRLNFNGSLSFIENIKEVKRTVLEAFENQNIPFNKIIETLKIDRNPMNNPLLKIMFSLEYDGIFPFVDLKKNNITHFNKKYYKYNYSKFDLFLKIINNENGLIINFEYSSEKFENKKIEIIGKIFKQLCHEVIANPFNRITKFISENNEISTTKFIKNQPTFEKSTIESDFNELKNNTFLLNIFENTCINNTASICITKNYRNISYGELNAKSDKFAEILMQSGVKPESIIAICLPSDIELFIILLSVIKCGAAFLPIDPDLPDKRKEYMIKDSKSEIFIYSDKVCSINSIFPDLIISSEKVDADVVSFSSLLVNGVDLLSPSMMVSTEHTFDTGYISMLELNKNNLNPVIINFKKLDYIDKKNIVIKNNSKNLAYVLYTSGSTGKPKGVGVSYESLINHIEWIQEKYKLSSEDNILMKTSISFDVSLWEIIWGLIMPSKIIIAPDNFNKNISKITSFIKSKNITVVHFVPSTLKMLNSLGEDLTTISSLRMILCIGENLSPSTLNFHVNKSKIKNIYGPTEATIGVTESSFCNDIFYENVSIGKPISNTNIYILNESLDPLPIGTVGEIYIGGKSIARGYINKPELTAEVFIPDPFSDNGSRMYKTGDLGKYLEDGSIEFIGRKDRQIKINGFRIELNEIENIILKYPGVEQVGVMEYINTKIKKLENLNTKSLKAFIGSKKKIDKKMLTTFLKDYLPDYMIPLNYVFRKELPFKTNGKLDFVALDDIKEDDNFEDTSPKKNDDDLQDILIGTVLENKIKAIWSKILNLEKDEISDDKNFFDLGGNSFLITQLQSEIKKELYLEINIIIFFKYPYIGSFTNYIKNLNFIEQKVDSNAI